MEHTKNEVAGNLQASLSGAARVVDNGNRHQALKLYGDLRLSSFERDPSSQDQYQTAVRLTAIR